MINHSEYQFHYPHPTLIAVKTLELRSNPSVTCLIKLNKRKN